MRSVACACVMLGAFSGCVNPANAVSFSHNAAIQYVSPQGDDSNDGLSWENAKLTGYAACEALAGGAVNPPTCGRGTIRIADNVAWGGPRPEGGLYEMGPGDPNYSSPPVGWQRYTGPLTMDCGIPTVIGPHGHQTLCTLLAGGAVGSPGFWLSSLSSFTMRNIAIQKYVSQAGRIGIDSNGNRGGTGGASGVLLDGISHNIGNVLGYGPDLDIGSNSFWLYIHAATLSGNTAEDYTIRSLNRSSNVVTVVTGQTNDLAVHETINIQNAADASFNGTYTVASVSGWPQTTFTFSQVGPNANSSGGYVFSSKSFGIAIDPGSGSGSGLIFVKEPVFSNGGIWLAPGTNGGGLYVDDMSIEGNPSGGTPPPILETRYVNPMHLRVNGIEESDFANSVPDVEIDGRAPFDALVARTDGGVIGPANVVGESAYSLSHATASPLRSGSIGTFGGRSNASTDAGRRLFGPVAVRFRNLSATLPASWTPQGSANIASGVTDPSGGTAAGSISSTSGISDVLFYSSSSVSYSPADFWVYGAWVRSKTGNGYVNNATPLQFSLNGNGVNGGGLCYGVGGPGVASSANGNSVMAPAYVGDGQWEWVSGLCKIQETATGRYYVNLVGYADPTHTVAFYGPTLLHIPSGTISDNEAWELATTLQSYSHDCAVGTICGMDGQILHEAAFNFKLGTPASSSDECTAGTIWADSRFVYVCTATNTIKRSALSSF